MRAARQVGAADVQAACVCAVTCVMAAEEPAKGFAVVQVYRDSAHALHRYALGVDAGLQASTTLCMPPHAAYRGRCFPAVRHPYAHLTDQYAGRSCLMGFMCAGTWSSRPQN